MPAHGHRPAGTLAVGAAFALSMVSLSAQAPTATNAAPAAILPDASAPRPPDPWQRAVGPWKWVFPRDHGAHPNFQTEWWYFTGNLREVTPGSEGHPYGYQLTIFRQGAQYTPAQTTSRWGVRDFYFGHFTISDIAANQFHVAERVTRAAFGEATADATQMDVKLGPWAIEQDLDEQIHLTVRDSDIALDLTEKPSKALVLEGDNGFSRKADSEGAASYYYSYPLLATSGNLRVDHRIFAVEGLSWFDHEFSTSSLGKDQVGWDWFCIQLENNQEIMLYAMRTKSGAIDPVSEGTWVNADGKSERLMPGSFTIEKLGTWTSAKSSAVYPAGWHVKVPAHQADLTVTPAMADQELNLTKMGKLSYWEGACTISGTVAGAAAKGVGYTELTGYASPLKMGTKE